mmetsp:Transcript_13376/g.34694  ORF Transcript_13376/g.34694 Transcript_13376/m.34694 type:complete len:289 (+) Transcript_13376:155-1021(+)
MMRGWGGREWGRGKEGWGGLLRLGGGLEHRERGRNGQVLAAEGLPGGGRRRLLLAVQRRRVVKGRAHWRAGRAAVKGGAHEGRDGARGLARHGRLVGDERPHEAERAWQAVGVPGGQVGGGELRQCVGQRGGGGGPELWVAVRCVGLEQARQRRGRQALRRAREAARGLLHHEALVVGGGLEQQLAEQGGARLGRAVPIQHRQQRPAQAGQQVAHRQQRGLAHAAAQALYALEQCGQGGGQPGRQRGGRVDSHRAQRVQRGHHVGPARRRQPRHSGVRRRARITPRRG